MCCSSPPFMRRFPSPSRSSAGARSHSLISRSTFRSRRGPAHRHGAECPHGKSYRRASRSGTRASPSPSPYNRASCEGSRSFHVFQGSSPIIVSSPTSKACRKSGSFPPPALPGINSFTTLSDSRPVHRHQRCRSCDLRPHGSPSIARITLPACRVQYPGRPNKCF